MSERDADTVDREDCRVFVENGNPVLEVGDTKVRLRCTMTHEAFPEMTLEGDDLDVHTETLVDGTVWHVENGLESELDVTIEPELVE